MVALGAAGCVWHTRDVNVARKVPAARVGANQYQRRGVTSSPPPAVPGLLRQVSVAASGSVPDNPDLAAQLVRAVGQLSEHTRWSIAQDDNVTPELLAAIVAPGVNTESDHGINLFVLRHPRCPPSVLQRAVQDYHDSWVEAIRAIAENRSCPSETLAGLLQHPDQRVRQLAKNNPALPRATLAMYQLAAHDGPVPVAPLCYRCGKTMQPASDVRWRCPACGTVGIA